MTESKEKKWIKIKLFTSTWRVWREFRVTDRNYDENLDATVEIKEVKLRVYPSINFESGIHGFRLSDGVYYELIAIIPEDDKEKIMNIWKKILEKRPRPVNILNMFLDYISDYCEKPAVISFYTDPDKVEIKID